MAHRIIAFDGGGIRGYLTTLLYERLDQAVQLAGCRPLRHDAHLFAGTSTGSFIAIASGLGIPMEVMRKLYLDDGARIFRPASATGDCAPWMLRLFGFLFPGDVREIFDAQYESGGLREALTENFVTKAPITAATLHDLHPEVVEQAGPRDVVVNSLQLASGSSREWTARVFGSAPQDELGEMPLVDAAMCSGAAPTYFPPHKPVHPSGHDWGYFADGGLFANNPSASALSYARRYFGADLDDTAVISLGTGTSAMGIPAGEIGNPQCWGALKWLDPEARGQVTPAAPLLEAALTSSQEVAGDYAALLLEKRYIRFDVKLDTPYPLDDYTHLGKLDRAVDRYLESEDWACKVQRVVDVWSKRPADGSTQTG